MRAEMVKLQSSLRSKDAEVQRQARLAAVGGTTRSETAEALAAAARDEAAVRVRTASELAAVRQRVSALEGALRGREREVERLGRALEAAQGAEAEVREGSRRRGCGRRRTGRGGEREVGRGREREVERLGRALEAAEGAEAEVRAWWVEAVRCWDKGGRERDINGCMLFQMNWCMFQTVEMM